MPEANVPAYFVLFFNEEEKKLYYIDTRCMRFTVNYAHVIIPADLESPKKMVSS